MKQVLPLTPLAGLYSYADTDWYSRAIASTEKDGAYIDEQGTIILRWTQADCSTPCLTLIPAGGCKPEASEETQPPVVGNPPEVLLETQRIWADALKHIAP